MLESSINGVTKQYPVPRKSSAAYRQEKDLRCFRFALHFIFGQFSQLTPSLVGLYRLYGLERSCREIHSTSLGNQAVKSAVQRLGYVRLV